MLCSQFSLGSEEDLAAPLPSSSFHMESERPPDPQEPVRTKEEPQEEKETQERHGEEEDEEDEEEAPSR